MMNKNILNNINLNSNTDSNSAINILILNIKASRDKMKKYFFYIFQGFFLAIKIILKTKYYLIRLFRLILITKIYTNKKKKK